MAERVGFEEPALRVAPRTKSQARRLVLGLRRKMAERVGFEPTSPVLPGYPLSRRALSTAQTPLQPRILAEPHAFSNPRDPLSAQGEKCLHYPPAFVR